MLNDVKTEFHTAEHRAGEAKQHRAGGICADSSVVVRSLNSDNYNDIRGVTNLYRRAFGDRYPFRQVYNERFWQIQDEQRLRDTGFVNLVAAAGRQIVAHLGLRCDRARRFAEITFVAVDPDCRAQIFGISRNAWRVVLEQAKRQNWQGIYYFCPLTQPASQIIAIKCFGAFETAILPGYLPARLLPQPERSRSDEDYYAVMAMSSQAFRTNRTVSISPPRRHADIVRSLLASVSETDSAGDITAAGNESMSAAVCPAGRSERGISLSYSRRTGVHRLRITPSRCTRPQLETTIARMEQHRACFSVSLNDAACPKVCELLEQRAYRFCGILPPAGGGDHIVYFRYEDSSLSSLCCYSRHGKELASYLKTQTLSC